MVEDSLLERDDVQELDTWFGEDVVSSVGDDRDLYVSTSGTNSNDIESDESYGRMIADKFDDIEYAYQSVMDGHAFNVVDTTEWVEINGVKWAADSVSIYHSEDVYDGERHCEYLVAADDVRKGSHVITWSVESEPNVDDNIVPEDIGRWVSERHIDDDVVDEYYVDTTEWIEVGGIKWEKESFAVYHKDDASAEDSNVYNDYMMAADDYMESKTPLSDPWMVSEQSNCDESVVDEKYGYWNEDISQDIIDEYLVDITPEWRETFERVFSNDDDIIHEIGNHPTVTTEYGCFSSFEMEDIYNEGYITWRIYENDDGYIEVQFMEVDE